MNKITFTDYPSTTTPISANNLNTMQSNIENEFTATVSDIQDALDEKVSTSVANSTYEKKGVLLWTNSSPTSSISSNTNITLNDSNYDMLEIVYLLYSNNTYYNSVKIRKGGNARLFSMSGTTFTYRNVTRNSDTSYTINTDSASAGNNIPVYIIGYKTGLF